MWFVVRIRSFLPTLQLSNFLLSVFRSDPPPQPKQQDRKNCHPRSRLASPPSCLPTPLPTMAFTNGSAPPDYFVTAWEFVIAPDCDTPGIFARVALFIVMVRMLLAHTTSRWSRDVAVPGPCPGWRSCPARGYRRGTRRRALAADLCLSVFIYVFGTFFRQFFHRLPRAAV